MPTVRLAVGAGADRDDRFAEGDDDDQPVALGEVAGDELPPLGAEQVRPAHVEQEGERPQGSLPEAIEKRCADEQPHADRRADREAGHGLAQRGVVAAGQHEQRNVRRAHHAIGQGELQRQLVEGLGDADPDDQERGHGGEDHDAHRALLGIDHAGQPRVARPRPPEHPEHQHTLAQPRPGRVIGHQRGALREREDEDEVEEELEWHHPLPFAQGGAEPGSARARLGGHDANHPCIGAARRCALRSHRSRLHDSIDGDRSSLRSAGRDQHQPVQERDAHRGRRGRSTGSSSSST